VANQTDKPKLQDPFITPSRIYVRDEHSESIFIGRSYRQKMAINESDPNDDKYVCIVH